MTKISILLLLRRVWSFVPIAIGMELEIYLLTK